ncbi:MAG TPA: M28 family peptidase [Planctomycetota bacterium]
MQVQSTYRSLLFAGLGIAASACGQTGGARIDPPAFDQDRAFADLRHLVEVIGERRIDTPGAAATRAYIRKQLEPHGWELEEQSFPVTPPEGARRKGELTGVNVLARRPGTVPGEIWIASHYDTYDLPGFVGANDGGSTTAILIELARQLGGKGLREGRTVVLAWFDGEERFTPEPWDDETNSTFGSRHAASTLKESGKLGDVQAFVLLDLAGDKDLGFYVEQRYQAAWLRQLVEQTARDLGWDGRDRILIGQRELKDDHMAFHKAGVPVLDLIDFNYGRNNAWWHTTDDTLDKCSAASLGKAGQLTLALLPRIETRLDSK